MSAQLVVIGGGAMGGGILAQIVAKGVFLPAQIMLVEHNPTRRRLIKKLGVAVAPNIDDIDFSKTRAVLLAVKPQDAPIVFSALHNVLFPQTLVISIMAGVTLKTLRRAINHQRIVRAMPNLPAQVGFGMTGWVATRACKIQDRAITEKIFAACGETIVLKNESAIDKLTAISGSGPGYIFKVADELVEAAITLGFSRTVATKLVRQTLIGAGAMFKYSADDPASLVTRVASKKGTTQAALDVLERKHTAAIWRAAVTAAYRRAKELGKQ